MKMKNHYKDQRKKSVKNLNNRKTFVGFSYDKANTIFYRLLEFNHHETEYSPQAFMEEWQRVDPGNLGYIDSS